MGRSLSPAVVQERDRWALAALGGAPSLPVAREVGSAVPDVAGQQPAPRGGHGGRTLVHGGDTVHLVDVGTGNFRGDHDSFARSVVGVGAVGPDT